MTLLVIAGSLLLLFALSGCASWNAERRAPMIGELATVDDVNLHVLTAGPRDSEKPPVILIHGASVNLRDMEMSLGQPLSADRFVLMIDRPGRGYSERPKNGYQLAVQARAINAVVKKYGLTEPIIVGQSFGGAVALNYALQFQDEINGLVLLAPVSHEWPGGVAWYNSASQVPLLGYFLRHFLIPVYGQLVAENGIKESFHPDAPPENYYDRAGLILLFRPKDFKANAEDIVNLKDEIKKQQHHYRELKIPVAIITGDEDTTVSPEIHSKTLAREIEEAQLTILKDTGHALHHAETEKIIAIINSISNR